MFKIIFYLTVLTAVCTFPAHRSGAGPLKSAEVTKIINRVSVVDPAKGDRPASLREVIKGNQGLQTGAKSRSELLFQDNTLTRIGAETFFSFTTGTRDMTLEKGSMLLQVPKGLGGATIHTAAVTAAITGTTILMEYIPDQYVKVLVLEGSLRLSRNGTFGDSLVLRPGKMVIMRPDAKKIPDPVDVDLTHIVKTSTLVTFPNEAPLPSMPLIQAAINEQAKQVAKRELVPTNLVMGHGTKLILASADQLPKTAGIPSLSSTNRDNGLVAGSNGDAGARALVDVVATNTPTTVTNLANNLLVPVANDFLSASSTGTAVSVSSSTQLLSLLSNAAPSSAGIITIVPAAITVTANGAALPAIVAPNASVNTGVVNDSTSGGTVNVNPPLVPSVTLATQPVITAPISLGLGR